MWWNYCKHSRYGQVILIQQGVNTVAKETLIPCSFVSSDEKGFFSISRATIFIHLSSFIQRSWTRLLSNHLNIGLTARHWNGS